MFYLFIYGYAESSLLGSVFRQLWPARVLLFLAVHGPSEIRGESTKQYSRQTLVFFGGNAREYPGGLLRLDPAFVYAEPPSS